MAQRNYFRYIPDFDYVSRLADSKNISDYIQVKNLFKRAKLRPDIWADLSKFTKYKIVGDERPDQVAYRQYKDLKVGQSKGPAGGPTSITKKTPKFKKPPTKSSPQYEHPIWKGPFPFKRNK